MVILKKQNKHTNKMKELKRIETLTFIKWAQDRQNLKTKLKEKWISISIVAQEHC